MSLQDLNALLMSVFNQCLENPGLKPRQEQIHQYDTQLQGMLQANNNFGLDVLDLPLLESHCLLNFFDFQSRLLQLRKYIWICTTQEERITLAVCYSLLRLF